MIVIAGRYIGHRGKLLRVIPETKNIIVSDSNKYKKRSNKRTNRANYFRKQCHQENDRK